MIPVLASLLLATAAVVEAGTISHPTPRDPVLTGTKGPCDADLAHADVVPGTDVDGNPVAPADVTPTSVPAGVDVLARLPNRDFVHVRTETLPSADRCPRKKSAVATH